jgi:hypothetical protein
MAGQGCIECTRCKGVSDENACKEHNRSDDEDVGVLHMPSTVQKNKSVPIGFDAEKEKE